jgi:prepilin-type processing-associated H-X9-DG protein
MTAPATPPPLPPPLPERPALDYVARQSEQSNVPAVVGLIFGVLLFVPFVFGAAAVVLGRMGIRRADELQGRGRRAAKAAVVLGVVNLVLSVLLVAASFPAVGRARRQAMQVKCASNMRQIAFAVMMYAQDNRGMAPPNLDLVQRYFGPGGGPVVCTCPDAADHGVSPAAVGRGTSYSYLYVAPAVPRLSQIPRAASTPMAYEPLANHGGRGINVVYWDGHVEWHNAAQAQVLIAQLRAAQAKATAPAAPPAQSPEFDGGTTP